MRRVSVWPAVILWAILMTPLLRWGLPSREFDALLFGGEPAWKAECYNAATAAEERRQRQAGADTDLNPLTARDRICHLTADEAARAEILRRYRLFSRQPDEMITFMALQRMRPRERDFDPKLYQYGGGFIYLVGGAIAATAALQLVQLTGNIAVYLERPELFADFYLTARLVTLVFGAFLLVAVWRLARRAAGRTAAWVALVLVACTPVFISDVVEAKPHVPSACMLLWAILSALDYHADGRRRYVLLMGLQVGYAFGLVLTGIAGVALWPVLLIARWRVVGPNTAERERLVMHLSAAAGLAAAVYVVTNPYIPYNYLFNRASLASNVDNSTAMYADQMQQAAAGAARVGELMIESAGLAVVVIGLIGLAYWLRQRPGQTILVAISGLAMLLICVLLGAGKPAEYARFLVLPVSLLCVACGCLAAALARRRRVWGLLLAIVALLPMHTWTYVRSLAIDAAGEHESRHLAARYIHDHAAPADTIAVLQEPAPYAVPPLDLAHREVYWLPPTEPAELDEQALSPWLVFTADDDEVHRGAWWTRYYAPSARFPAHGGLSRITWANKPVFVFRRIAP